jgi:pyruvate formate lyase activating enzyme
MENSAGMKPDYFYSMEEPDGGEMTRREFVSRSARACAAACAATAAFSGAFASTAAAQSPAREVLFYEKLKGNSVRCGICPRKCVVPDGARGFCGNKVNRGGKYITLAHSGPCAVNNDPVEKKPFSHVMPGTTTFSIAEAGCNFTCKFCQNWELSQSKPEEVRRFDMPPAQVAKLAAQAGSPSISFTYGEPTVFCEYVYDTAKQARENGLRCLMISNGYINPEPMKKLLTVLDAVKIDFKAYSDDFYRDVCSGRLQPVLDTIKLLKKEKKWFELVNLMIPTLNDAPEMIEGMAKWILDNLGPHTPLHFTRFTPKYKLANLPPTPPATLERAKEICDKAGLKYVYIGNIPGHPAESTYCHACGKRVVERHGYVVKANLLNNGKCPGCGAAIPGLWA